MAVTILSAEAGRCVPSSGVPAAQHSSPPTSSSPHLVPQRFYRPELDFLRLVAFCMVWCAHASLSFRGLVSPGLLTFLQSVGSLGVPIFFFLSAFLITELMRREHLLTGTVHLRMFYLRRILRIWPLYLGVLAIYALLGLMFHAFRIEPGRLAASVLLVGNWYIVAHPAITTPLRSFWSISVEEQWYLLWPLLFCWVSWRSLLLVCVGVACLAQATLAILAAHATQSQIPITAWNNSAVQFQFLAAGALSALLLRGRIPALSSTRRIALGVGAAATMAAAAWPCGIKRTDMPHSTAGLCLGYLLAGIGAGACFFALYGTKASLFPRLMVRLGQLSFGLYILHETAFFLTDAFFRALLHVSALRYTVSGLLAEKALAFCLTVVLAFASYHLWELPFLKLKQRWTIVPNRQVS